MGLERVIITIRKFCPWKGDSDMIRGMLQRLMYGRYGRDKLNDCLIGLYLVLLVLYMFTRLAPLYWLSFFLVVVVLFRMLSRNFSARRPENAQFLKVTGPIVRWYRLRRTMHQDKEPRYFKCPNCGQHLRVPKGKGKITVTCRGCGATFEERS